MIDLSFLKGAKVGIVGLGKSGLGAARSLQQAGAHIYAWDDNENTRANFPYPIADLNAFDLTQLDFIVWSPGIAHQHDNAHAIARRARALNVPLICDVELFCQAVTNDILAVTGTNGKSTTTALLGHILQAFRPTEIGGNIGQPVLSLDSLPEDGAYVLELSSYQLELTPSLRAHGAILLNITPDHLGRHGGLEGYIAAKELMFTKTPQEERKPIAVICIDTQPALQIADKLESSGAWQIVRVSTQTKLNNSFFAENSKIHHLVNGEEVAAIDISAAQALRGVHNLENAACAFALVRMLYGYDPKAIEAQINSFPGLPHRQYPVRTINGVIYINDSKATNADATSKALACFKNIYWILGGQAKEGGLAGLEIYTDRIKHAYLIGEAAPGFAKWLDAAGVPYTNCETLDVAVLQAHEDAQHNRGQPGGSGVVLLSPACASWDQFQSFEHRGDSFAALVKTLAED